MPNGLASILCRGFILTNINSHSLRKGYYIPQMMAALFIVQTGVHPGQISVMGLKLLSFTESAVLRQPMALFSAVHKTTGHTGCLLKNGKMFLEVMAWTARLTQPIIILSMVLFIMVIFINQLMPVIHLLHC